MDISKVEKQAPTEHCRSDDSDYLRTFLQDILALLILFCLGMVIVLGVLCVVYNVQYQEQHSHSAKTNGSQVMQPTTSKSTWLLFFRCLKQQPQLDAKLEVLELKGDQGEIHPAKLEESDKRQLFAPHPAPTYQHPQLQAGGPHN